MTEMKQSMRCIDHGNIRKCIGGRSVMGQERVEGYAEGFRVGWNKSLEVVDMVIDEFCFGDKEENIEVKRELKQAITFAQVGEGVA